MDVDRLHAEIQDLTRRDWDKLPPECAAADGRRLAGKINQLTDWVGLGGRLPERWRKAQRVGPYAKPVRQELFLDSRGVWCCRSCGRELLTEEGDNRSAAIQHGNECLQVRP